MRRLVTGRVEKRTTGAAEQQIPRCRDERSSSHLGFPVAKKSFSASDFAKLDWCASRILYI